MHTTHKKSILLSLLLFCTTLAVQTSVHASAAYEPRVEIVADCVDHLVLKGIAHILKHGRKITSHAGDALQANNTTYVLLNSLRRVHALRAPTSIQYVCREFLAYFDGSLKVKDGLAQASKVWKDLADANGEICSNYGYYVFRQNIPGTQMTQYDWVIDCLMKNNDSRKAFININDISHKKPTTGQDFPCTIGMQFLIKPGDDGLNYVCCEVSSRSTDVFTGLPYDMAFFSFVTELVYTDLQERLPKEKSDMLKLGYTTMTTTFTQIYDKTLSKAQDLLAKNEHLLTACPQGSTSVSSKSSSSTSCANSSRRATVENLLIRTPSASSTPLSTSRSSLGSAERNSTENTTPSGSTPTSPPTTQPDTPDQHLDHTNPTRHHIPPFSLNQPTSTYSPILEGATPDDVEN